jgi:ferredoxin-NADP reductase
MDVVLTKIVDESPLVKTFRFVTPRMIRFLPGQYATFKFNGIPSLNEDGVPAVRTWTLSETAMSSKGDNTLEVSIKRMERAEVSDWMHSHA